MFFSAFRLMTGQQPPSRFPTRNYLLRQPFFLICLSHWDGFVCQRLFVSIPEVSISTRFFWTRLVWIFPGIFSNVVLWRKVFCKHVLQIKFFDHLLTFSKNSGNVFIDLLMVLLWLFFCKYFLPLSGLFLGLFWIRCMEYEVCRPKNYTLWLILPW